MSGYEMVFFASTQEMIEAFEAQAPAVERELSPRERWVNGRLETCGRIEAWGDSLLGADAVTFAVASVARSNERWWSQIDPREEAGEQISGLVCAIWRAVAATGVRPRVHVESLPARVFEERPNQIPRARGVRYYPTVSLADFIRVPRGQQVAVAVRAADPDGE